VRSVRGAKNLNWIEDCVRQATATGLALRCHGIVLGTGFGAGDAFGPILFKLVIADLEILHDVGVVENQIVFGTGLKKLLLYG
jgi:hypothetical protein